MAHFETGDHAGNHISNNNGEHERLAASQRCYESLADSLYERHPSLRPILNAIESPDELDSYNRNDSSKEARTVPFHEMQNHVLKLELRGLLDTQVECSKETKQARLKPSKPSSLPDLSLVNEHASAFDVYEQ